MKTDKFSKKSYDIPPATKKESRTLIQSLSLGVFTILVGIIIIATVVFSSCSKEESIPYESLKLYARFMTNCPEETVELNSSYTAIGENTLFEKMEIVKGSTISQPQTNPVRSGYDFAGWSTDKDGIHLFDFSRPLQTGITLYAKWVRSEEQAEENNFQEVIPVFTQKVNPEQSEQILLSGVLNTKIQSGIVSLPKASMAQIKKAGDLAKLLNYSVKSSDVQVTASYNQTTKILTVTAHKDSEEDTVISITVLDASGSYPVSNSTYENKAQIYEMKEIAPYTVILAGSSSMENWSTSTQDMRPLTTSNVGIGGTTVDMWRDSLCERLVYPFSPRAVVFYVGINNIINTSDNGETTGHKLEELFDQVHDRLPDTHIYYVLVNSVPGYYVKYGNDFQSANSIVKEYAKDKSYMTLIDAGNLLIKESGKPNEAYFLSDGLHMSICGYEVWGKEVREAVIAKEKQLYTK